MVRFARYVLRADVLHARGKCQQRRVARAADDRADDDAARRGCHDRAETTISGATLAMGLSGIAIVNSGCGGAMGLSE